jgi:hypothetical protein
MGIETVAAVMSIVGGVSSMMQGRQADKEAKAAAAEQERMAREQQASAERAALETEQINRRNVANIEAETMENARKAKEAEASEAARRRALGAATGIATDQASSLDIFMGAQKDKFQSELDWLLKSGASQADIAAREGRYAANNLRTQGQTALSSGYFSAGQLRNQGSQAKWQGISSGLGSIGSGASGLYSSTDWFKPKTPALSSGFRFYDKTTW